jgi:hypothetical protein
MKTFTPEELSEIIRLHGLYAVGDLAGCRANLSCANLTDANLTDANLTRANLTDANLTRANLSGANLSGANLSRAYLSGANLTRANLTDANLTRANLTRANLTDANLTDANLTRANLTRANLTDANLTRANLTDANLTRANLSGANLTRANLTDAKSIELALARASHVPAEGGFQAWKKCAGNVIVRLWIPDDARRSHGRGRKCRAAHVQVLEVIGAEEGRSIYDLEQGKKIVTTYRTGEMVACDSWCEDRWTECGGGIHFFMHRLEAEAFEF